MMHIADITDSTAEIPPLLEAAEDTSTIDDRANLLR